VMTEPSWNSVHTARHISGMSTELGIEKVRITGYKIRSTKEKDFIAGSFDPEVMAGSFLTPKV